MILPPETIGDPRNSRAAVRRAPGLELHFMLASSSFYGCKALADTNHRTGGLPGDGAAGYALDPAPFERPLGREGV